jgi:hypothetical protein
MVVIDPGRKAADESQRTHLLLRPKTLLFERVYHALRIGIPYWIAVAGTRVMDSQGAVCLDKGE